ncbi:MAG: hypothetical protein AB7T49_14605 [Oligoflexales bacterium]
MSKRFLTLFFGGALFSCSAFADEVVTLDYYFYLDVAKRDVPLLCAYQREEQWTRRTVDVYLEDDGDSVIGSFEANALRGSAGPNIPDARMIGTITKDNVTNKFNLSFEVFQSLNGVETYLKTWNLKDLDSVEDTQENGLTWTNMQDGRRWCRTSVGLHFGWVAGPRR